MTAKTLEEIRGLEFDWLACDAHGHVAFFSTAGSGQAPRSFLSDTEAHSDAIDALLELPATCEARFAPTLGAEFLNTWRLMAMRGVYALDCDPNGGDYRLVAAPTVPRLLSALPERLRTLVEGIVFTDLNLAELENGEEVSLRFDV